MSARRHALVWLAALALACGREKTQPAPYHAEHAEHTEHTHRDLAGGAPAELSLYQLAGRWTKPDGATLELAELRGKPVLLLLFYGTCDYACPLLVHDLERVAELLPSDAGVRFVLVTFDPERDTPARLAAYARQHELDPLSWTLLHGDPEQVRELAAATGVRYRPTGTGQFSHTMRILLLDREGVVVEHWDGLERPVEPIAARAAALARQP